MLRIWKSRIVAVAPILFLLPARFAAGEVLVHIALPEANAAYSAGEVIPIEVEFLTSEEPVAGMDLHIKCESDALLIQNVTFDQAFSLALLPTSTTLPSKFFRDVRVRDAGREPADSGLASATGPNRIGGPGRPAVLRAGADRGEAGHGWAKASAHRDSL
jgi:hypothetical protein